jgi:hypothetical protein
MEAATSDKIRRKAAEYNVVEHCNLKCALCDHSSPLLPRKFADLESFRADLRVLSSVLHLDELKLLGGEPLLHPDLVSFLQVARESGLAERITLVTNGVLLHRADPKIFDWIDMLWISTYPGVKIRADLTALRKLAQERGFRLRLKAIAAFRQTALNSRNGNDALVSRIYRSCHLAHVWSCHTIHEGRYFKCSPAPFLQPRMALRGTAVDNRPRDGVAIHGNPMLRSDLERYLASAEPLEACFYCLGSVGREFPHRQLDRPGLLAERDAAHESPGELIDTRLRGRLKRAVVTRLALS